MIPSFSENYGLPSENDVLNLERTHSITFPKDYRDFLLTINGGVPNPSLFVFNNDFFSEIIVFSSITPSIFKQNNPNSNSNDLHYLITKGNQSYLNTASNGVGDGFILFLTGPHRGEVYFWVHDIGWEPDDTEDPKDNKSMTFLTQNFQDFLNSAVEFHPQESEFERLLRTKDFQGAWKYLHNPNLDIHQLNYYEANLLDLAVKYYVDFGYKKTPEGQEILKIKTHLKNLGLT